MPAIPRVFLVLSLLLSACAAAPVRAQAASDGLGAVMAGEFALQAGQLEDATRWYLQAARESGDAGLAERATRIALLANADVPARDALALWKAAAPRSLAMRAAEATLSLRQGREREARREVTALMRMEGEEGWRHALAALDGAGRTPAASARLLDRLVDDNLIPPRLQPWLAFAGLAQRLGQPELAERIVSEVIRRFPDEPRVALLHANQLRDAGRNDEARGVLDRLRARPPAAESLRMSLAAEYDALGDPATAAAVLAQGPQDERSLALRASLLARADDKPALTALYETLRKDAARPDPRRRLLLGQVAEFLERREEALEWYRGVPGGAERWVARLRTASVLHALQRPVEALAELRALQADASADDDARRDAYLLEAELRAAGKDPAAEMDAYARGLAAFPDDESLLYARALAWERRDDIARAEADFRRILVSDPDNVNALNALGYTLADRTDRHAEALELISRARAADPGSAAIIDSYGWVLYRLGRHADALVELRRAFALQKDPEIAAHIGEVLWVRGDRDEARRWFDEARRLDPDNRSLRRALEKLGL